MGDGWGGAASRPVEQAGEQAARGGGRRCGAGEAEQQEWRQRNRVAEERTAEWRGPWRNEVDGRSEDRVERRSEEAEGRTMARARGGRRRAAEEIMAVPPPPPAVTTAEVASSTSSRSRSFPPSADEDEVRLRRSLLYRYPRRRRSLAPLLKFFHISPFSPLVASLLCTSPSARRCRAPTCGALPTSASLPLASPPVLLTSLPYPSAAMHALTSGEVEKGDRGRED